MATGITGTYRSSFRWRRSGRRRCLCRHTRPRTVKCTACARAPPSGRQPNHRRLTPDLWRPIRANAPATHRKTSVDADNSSRWWVEMISPSTRRKHGRYLIYGPSRLDVSKSIWLRKTRHAGFGTYGNQLEHSHWTRLVILFIQCRRRRFDVGASRLNRSVKRIVLNRSIE